MGNANCHGLFRTLAVKKPSASQELVGDDEDAGPNFWADLCFGNFFIEYGDEGSPATGAEMGIHSVCLVKGGGAMGKLEPKDHSEEELWQTLDVLTQSAQADSDEEEEEELEEASPELGWQLLREGKQRDAAMRSASEARSAVEGASCSANCNGNSRDLMGPRGCLGNMTVSCCGEEEGMDFTLRVTCKGRFGKQEGGASCGGVFDSEEHIHAPNVKVDLYGLCVGKMKAKKLGHQPQDTDCDCESGECLCRPRPKKGVMIGCFGNLETGTLVAGGPEDARQAFKREVAAVATI